MKHKMKTHRNLTSFVISVFENLLDGSFITVSWRYMIQIFLIMKTMNRVDMLAIGYFLCHRIYYHICCDSRDTNGHHHLCHHWRHNITPLVPFLHTILDLKTKRFVDYSDGSPTSRGTIQRKLYDYIVKSCETMPSPSLFSFPSRVQPYTRFARSSNFRLMVPKKPRAGGDWDGAGFRLDTVGLFPGAAGMALGPAVGWPFGPGGGIVSVEGDDSFDSLCGPTCQVSHIRIRSTVPHLLIDKSL